MSGKRTGAFFGALFGAVLAFSLPSGVAIAGPDENAIVTLLRSTFDKPEARLTISPTVIVGNYGIAGWSQGDMGGRALLRRSNDQWSIVLCAGDGIRWAESLLRAGVPEAEARALSAKLADAERALPPERLALLAKFEGIVMMDASGEHPRH
jgi:hypothetical protein